ncbi:MAG TPA: SHOCT domain-containing protein [Ilumatobacteraceae bacterium]|nr:SHOCT domain-containing protein [Ilumatobacteraceae bacterium]
MDFWDFFWLLLIYLPLVLLWTFALVDIFRRDDMSAAGKTLWVVIVIFLPFVGTLIYMLFRPAATSDQRMIREATDTSGAMRYGAPTDNATQLRVLSDLHDAGKLTDAEFDNEKTRILSGR